MGEGAMSKIKIVSEGYTQLFDHLQSLGADVNLSGVVGTPPPGGVSNITPEDRERSRLLALPVQPGAK
jgi:hypothetical protein